MPKVSAAIKELFPNRYEGLSKKAGGERFMSEPAGNLNAILQGKNSGLFKCEKGDAGFGVQALFITIGLKTNVRTG